MKKSNVIKALVSSMFLLSATLITGQSASAKVYRAQVSSQMPVKHPITAAMNLFVKTANEKSGGRLKIAHFPSGQLLTDREVPKAINKGSVQMAQTFFMWWAGLVPELQVYGGKQPLTLEHSVRIYRGPGIEYRKKTLAKSNSAGKTDVKIIAPLMYGFNGGYIMKKPVHNPGDMQGMKIRIPTRVLAAEVTALGGVPTVMSSADVYISLQRNTIQGAISGLPSFYARKWYEGAKYVFSLRPLYNDFHIVANRTWFNNLPAELQQVIMDAGQTASKAATKMALGMERKIESMLKAKGVEIIRVTPEEYQTKWASLVEPALRETGIKQCGKERADLWDSWVESTR